MYAVLVALLLGSFINLAADRLPRGESVVRPRSRCRACGRVLNAVDLLPVLGYAIRGGRCASCRTPIGVDAPMVEATCGGLMIFSIWALGLWPGGMVGLVMVVLLGAGLVCVARLRREFRPDRGNAL